MTKKFRLKEGVFVLASYLVCFNAYAAPVSRIARLTFQSENKVVGLKWDSLEIPILERKKNKATNDTEFYVVLKGSYVHEDYGALFDDVRIPDDKLAHFSRVVVLRSAKESITFKAISPKGTVESEVVSINVPQYIALRTESFDQTPKKRIGLSLSVGPSLVTYSQADLPNYNQIFLTVRANLNYLINARWDLSANTFYNALKLSSNQADAIRFWGVNGRIGYVLPLPKSEWRFILNGGWYYITTFSDGLGFQNLSGPQLFPLARYWFNSKQAAYFYFKFSPVSNNFSISFSSREMAVGGGYTFPLFGQMLTAGLDFSTITLTFSPPATTANSATFSIGMGF